MENVIRNLCRLISQLFHTNCQPHQIVSLPLHLHTFLSYFLFCFYSRKHAGNILLLQQGPIIMARVLTAYKSIINPLPDRIGPLPHRTGLLPTIANPLPTACAERGLVDCQQLTYSCVTRSLGVSTHWY